MRSTSNSASFASGRLSSSAQAANNDLSSPMPVRSAAISLLCWISGPEQLQYQRPAEFRRRLDTVIEIFPRRPSGTATPACFSICLVSVSESHRYPSAGPARLASSAISRSLSASAGFRPIARAADTAAAMPPTTGMPASASSVRASGSIRSGRVEASTAGVELRIAPAASALRTSADSPSCSGRRPGVVVEEDQPSDGWVFAGAATIAARRSVSVHRSEV